jgi:UDP-2-acetamido-3-amino-2,3-dideoxy-glucuronate N-acetyltransferase
MNAQRRVRICVAGCGHWGKNLVRNFHELGHLYGFCESDGGLRASFASQYPEARAFGRFEEALEDPQVEAVVLATPAEQHYPMGRMALGAGKDLYVEKPLALDWEEGLELTGEAERRGRVLMVGHLLRYHPAFLKIEEMAAAGELGTIDYIYSNRLSMGKIRHEENALWSFAPHDISLILALTGRMPVQAVATGGAYLQANIADVTVSQLLFERGTRAHIFVSWLHPYKEQRLVVIGSRQMAVFEETRADNRLVLYDKQIEWKNGVITSGKASGKPVEYASTEPLRLECAHFAECVARRARPRTPGEEGVRVLQVLQACQRSLQMNGEPVQLSYAAAQPLRQL